LGLGDEGVMKMMKKMMKRRKEEDEEDKKKLKCSFGPLSIYLVSFWSQNLGWCVVDDEDHEEKDGRRRKKMNSTNPNVFLNLFNRRDQNR